MNMKSREAAAAAERGSRGAVPVVKWNLLAVEVVPVVVVVHLVMKVGGGLIRQWQVVYDYVLLH